MNYLERLFTETVDTHFDKGSVRVSVTHCKYDTVYNVTLTHPRGFQKVCKIPMELTYHDRLQQIILDYVFQFKQRVDRIKPNPDLEDTIKEILSEAEPDNIEDDLTTSNKTMQTWLESSQKETDKLIQACLKAEIELVQAFKQLAEYGWPSWICYRDGYAFELCKTNSKTFFGDVPGSTKKDPQ